VDAFNRGDFAEAGRCVVGGQGEHPLWKWEAAKFAGQEPVEALCIEIDKIRFQSDNQATVDVYSGLSTARIGRRGPFERLFLVREKSEWRIQAQKTLTIGRGKGYLTSVLDALADPSELARTNEESLEWVPPL
jgi:hypothetical protein